MASHHIAERYGLLVIVTLGEGVVGTVAALSGAVDAAGGWSLPPALVVIAGIGLTFGMWWMYFAIDFGRLVHAHVDRSVEWGYEHIVLFMAIAATGAGLHVVGTFIEGAGHVSELLAVGMVAVPVGLFYLMLFLLYGRLTRTFNLFHLLLGGLAVVQLAAIGLPAAGVSIGWCLVVTAAATMVGIVGYETRGYQHQEQALRAEELSGSPVSD